MKSDRVMSVLMVLLEGKRVRAQDLADRLEVSVRTVYRDIDTLCAAGIPVRSIGGAKGGVELMPGYRLDGRLFSPEEHSALLAGLSNLSAMLGTDALARTLSKLRGILPDAQTGAIERRAAQIVIDPEPWLGDGRTKQTLEIVETALEARRLLAFAYLDRFGNRSERAVEPYRLVLKGDQWYFQGYCETTTGCFVCRACSTCECGKRAFFRAKRRGLSWILVKSSRVCARKSRCACMRPPWIG